MTSVIKLCDLIFVFDPLAGADPHLLPPLYGNRSDFCIINIFLMIKHTFQVETWPISCLKDSKTQEGGL